MSLPFKDLALPDKFKQVECLLFTAMSLLSDVHKIKVESLYDLLNFDHWFFGARKERFPQGRLVKMSVRAYNHSLDFFIKPLSRLSYRKS